MTTELTQEEMDAVIYDAREGDLQTLKEIFTEILPQLLTTIKDDITLSTPVHMAAGNGHFEVVKYLLSILPKEEAKQIASKPNESGNTPLHWAAYNGHLDIVKLLCEEYNSDVFAKNAVGHDPMFEAENNNHSEVENWLLNKYAPENAFKVEENGEDTKITYTPGDVSREADEAAKKAQEDQSKNSQKNGGKEAGNATDTITQQTEKLDINNYPYRPPIIIFPMFLCVQSCVAETENFILNVSKNQIVIMSDLGFDPTLKKKKKAKKPESDVSESPAPAGEIDDMFAGLKKKKKSKKPVDDTTEASASPAADDLTDTFGDLTLKKKKKKSVKSLDAADFDQQLEEAGLEDISQTNDDDNSASTAGGPPYEDLLSRFFGILKKNNPELAGNRSGPKFRIPPPVCQREGSKKTLFANVQEIATVLQRNPEHLIQFLFAELGTSGSIDGEKRLVLKGKFQPKQMESVLRRYILEYVTCKTCKSMNTELKRESANRLHFLSCKACGSTRSVSSIKTGFQAQIGKRKRM